MSLFARYPGRPSEISGVGDDLVVAGRGFGDVGRSAAQRVVPAADNVLGFLIRPMRLATVPVNVKANELGGASAYAASVLSLWAGHVSMHDARVDQLNAEYETAAGGGFGVERGDDDTDAEHADAVAAARGLKVAELTHRKRVADETLDRAGHELAAMLERGPNDDDWSTLGSFGAVPADFSHLVPGGAPGEPGGPEFVVGPPTRPDIEWDDDFEYDSASPGLTDHLARAKWLAMLRGGQLLKPELDDATQMYRHYWSNTGDDIRFDYEEAYLEDDGVRAAIDAEIERARRGAEQLVLGGNREFSMTGDARATDHYPTSENWQKTIGGHQTWSSADVRVDGDRVTMEITVHGEDYYNFNRGQSDIASGASDDENGRFTEVGWARPFHSSGEVTRTVTWTLGEDDLDTGDAGSPDRNPGREDREDERNSESDRSSRPQSDRDTGRPRGS